MAKIGYARVSTQDQSLDGQIDTLEEYGCERIFSEKASGRKTKRTELDKCLDYLREGDILVIYKLDRLGRTTKQLIELSQWFDENSIDLHIIDMNVSTKDALAASSPFLVRSLNKLASSSANALIIVKNILPIASLVDTFISIICKPILLSSNH